MSRGGTRRARALQEEKRRARRRKEKARGSSRWRKRERKPRSPAGRGRAILLHLSGIPTPLVIGFGLAVSGTETVEDAAYWPLRLMSDPGASYLREPAGLLYAALVFALASSIFALLPVWLWRRLYRSRDVLARDWSSVDGTFTLAAVGAVGWVVRIVVGYNDVLANFAVIMSILSVYVPVFSAVLAIGLPVVPGSGRIGGILPGFLRIRFTERFLLDDDELERVRSVQKSPAEDAAGG